MTDRRSRFETKLEDWIDDGPLVAPGDLLASVLVEFPRVTQRRRPWSWLTPLFRVTAVAASLLVVAAVVAVTWSPTRPGSDSPTPGWASRFAVQSANDFPDHPFSFAIDPASGIVVTAHADPYQFRVPHGPDNFDEGVIVHSIGAGLRSDVCNEGGGNVDAHPDADQIAAAIQSLDGLEVSAVEPATVDGRSGRAVTVTNVEGRQCDYFLFDGYEPAFAWSGNEGRTRRIIAVDVDGDPVIIEIVASNDRYEAWLPTASAFVDTIDFTSSY